MEAIELGGLEAAGLMLMAGGLVLALLLLAHRKVDRTAGLMLALASVCVPFLGPALVVFIALGLARKAADPTRGSGRRGNVA